MVPSEKHLTCAHAEMLSPSQMVLIAITHRLCLRGIHQPIAGEHHPNVFTVLQKQKKCSKQNSLTAAQLPPTGKRRLKITVSPSTPLSPSLSPPSSPLPASYLIQCSSPVDFTSVVFPLSCPQNFTCDYYLNQMVITEFFTFNLLSSSSRYLLRRGESPQSTFWGTLFIAVGSHHSVLNTRVIVKHLRGHLKRGFQTTSQIFFSHHSSPHYR